MTFRVPTPEERNKRRIDQWKRRQKAARRTERAAVAFLTFLILFWLAFWGTVIFVVVHFLTKWW